MVDIREARIRGINRNRMDLNIFALAEASPLSSVLRASRVKCKGFGVRAVLDGIVQRELGLRVGDLMGKIDPNNIFLVTKSGFGCRFQLPLYVSRLTVLQQAASEHTDAVKKAVQQLLAQLQDDVGEVVRFGAHFRVPRLVFVQMRGKDVYPFLSKQDCMSAWMPVPSCTEEVDSVGGLVAHVLRQAETEME